MRVSQESSLSLNTKTRYTLQRNKIRLFLEENTRSYIQLPPRPGSWDVGDESLWFLKKVEKSGPSLEKMFGKLPDVSINAQ